MCLASRKSILFRSHLTLKHAMHFQVFCLFVIVFSYQKQKVNGPLPSLMNLFVQQIALFTSFVFLWKSSSLKLKKGFPSKNLCYKEIEHEFSFILERWKLVFEFSQQIGIRDHFVHAYSKKGKSNSWSNSNLVLKDARLRQSKKETLFEMHPNFRFSDTFFKDNEYSYTKCNSHAAKSSLGPKLYSLFISSSGKSFLMNMALHPLETTRAPPNSNWNASMCTTTRPLEANTCHEPSSWIWSLVPWTRSGLALMAKFSGLITLSLDNQELETIGPRDITPKVCVWYYLL